MLHPPELKVEEATDSVPEHHHIVIVQVSVNELHGQAQLLVCLQLVLNRPDLSCQIVNGLPADIELGVGLHLLEEELSVDGVVHPEHVKVGGNGGLHVDGDAAHGGAQLACGPAHLFWAGGLGERAWDEVKDAGSCATGQHHIGLAIQGGQGLRHLEG